MLEVADSVGRGGVLRLRRHRQRLDGCEAVIDVFVRRDWRDAQGAPRQQISKVKDTTNRASHYRELATKLGCTVKENYWTQGQYDVVSIVDAPDEASMTALAMSVGKLGYVRTQTLRAYSAAELAPIMDKVILEERRAHCRRGRAGTGSPMPSRSQRSVTIQVDFRLWRSPDQPERERRLTPWRRGEVQRPIERRLGAKTPHKAARS